MADTPEKTIQLIDDKIEEMKPILDRMDIDEKLYFLETYVMSDAKGKAIPDVSNVTLNDPLTYGTKAIAILGSYQRQTEIEGNDLNDRKTTKIEEYLADVDYMVDERLVKRGIISLDAFIDEQICIRGHIGARSCVRLDKEGKFIPDVLPLDTRYFPYDNDDKGMIWGTGIFTRSKGQIEREYEKELSSKPMGLKKWSNEVRDFWDSTINRVFIIGQVIREIENTWGYPPFVRVACPSGSTLNTELALKHKGEGIFWANRDLFSKKNEIASLLNTLSIEAIFGGMQYASSKGEGASKPKETPYGPRKVIPVEKDGGFKPLPVNDIKNATRMLYTILETCLQKGSLTPLDYGTLTFPLSGVTVHSLIGAREDIFLPRLQAIALFRQALSKMMIDQTIKLGTTVYLGKEGKENEYTPQDLQGDYTIRYRFSLVTKEQTAADAALANSMKGTLSDDYIRRRIFRVDDPDGMKATLDSEAAVREDDVLRNFFRGLGFIYEAEELKGNEKRIKQYAAKTIMQRIRTIMAQRRAMGQLSPMEGKELPSQPQKQLLPVLGGGQGGGAKGTPQPEEEQTE